MGRDKTELEGARLKVGVLANDVLRYEKLESEWGQKAQNAREDLDIAKKHLAELEKMEAIR